MRECARWETVVPGRNRPPLLPIPKVLPLPSRISVGGRVAVSFAFSSAQPSILLRLHFVNTCLYLPLASSLCHSLCPSFVYWFIYLSGSFIRDVHPIFRIARGIIVGFRFPGTWMILPCQLCRTICDAKILYAFLLPFYFPLQDFERSFSQFRRWKNYIGYL